MDLVLKERYRKNFVAASELWRCAHLCQLGVKGNHLTVPICVRLHCRQRPGSLEVKCTHQGLRAGGSSVSGSQKNVEK